MTESGPREIGMSVERKPHAYDPAAKAELFEGGPPRRLFAFAIDLVIIMLPVGLAGIFVFFLGLVGSVLFALVCPASVIWALLYRGPASATIGMRGMDLEMRTWYGAPAYFVLRAVHASVFWITISALTPLVLVVGLLHGRRRLLHDIPIGTVVIDNAVRAEARRALRRRS